MISIKIIIILLMLLFISGAMMTITITIIIIIITNQLKSLEIKEVILIRSSLIIYPIYSSATQLFLPIPPPHLPATHPTQSPHSHFHFQPTSRRNEQSISNGISKELELIIKQ